MNPPNSLHPPYIAMAADDASRRDNDRALFRTHIGSAAIADIQLGIEARPAAGDRAVHGYDRANDGAATRSRTARKAQGAEAGEWVVKVSLIPYLKTKTGRG
jgi:hypothetical protein